jgi:hypothetical protein
VHALEVRQEQFISLNGKFLDITESVNAQRGWLSMRPCREIQAHLSALATSLCLPEFQRDSGGDDS